MTDAWDAQMKTLGSFIRSQRKLANLSLRQLAELTSLSNPYLSQIERGLHQPSVRVLRLLAVAAIAAGRGGVGDPGRFAPRRRAEGRPAGGIPEHAEGIGPARPQCGGATRRTPRGNPHRRRTRRHGTKDPGPGTRTTPA